MQGVLRHPVLDWLGEAVLASDRREQPVHGQAVKKLKVQYDQIELRIEGMYLDKLDGRIGQELFDKHAVAWRRDQERLLERIQELQKSAPAPVDQAYDMLNLTSRASELFLAQCPGEQRRLLQIIIEKAAWQNGTLQTTLFEPFEMLRHSNRESYRKEKEYAGSGRDLEVWLLG